MHSMQYVALSVALICVVLGAPACATGPLSFDMPYWRITDAGAMAPNLYHFGQTGVESANQVTYVCRIIGMLPAQKKLTLSRCYITGREVLNKLTNGVFGRIIATAGLTNRDAPRGCNAPDNFPLLISVYAGQPLGIFTWDLQASTNCISPNSERLYNFDQDYWNSRMCSDFWTYTTKAYAQGNADQMEILNRELNTCTSRQVWQEVRDFGNPSDNGQVAQTVQTIAGKLVGLVPTIGSAASGLMEVSIKVAEAVASEENRRLRDAEKRVQEAIADAYLVPIAQMLHFSTSRNSMGSTTTGSTSTHMKSTGGTVGLQGASTESIRAMAKASLEVIAANGVGSIGATILAAYENAGTNTNGNTGSTDSRVASLPTNTDNTVSKVDAIMSDVGRANPKASAGIGAGVLKPNTI